MMTCLRTVLKMPVRENAGMVFTRLATQAETAAPQAMHPTSGVHPTSAVLPVARCVERM